MELVQLALQMMQMQATDDEKAEIDEALEARPQDIDALKAISQDIAAREDSSSEETEEAVTIEGPIEGLTDLASAASEDEVNLAVDRLVEYGLITNLADARIHLDVPAWPDPATGAVVLDAHPLVREHFAEQLKQEHKSSSVEAHRRLYEHLKQSAPELPDNLNDMMPLYHAVAHGCKAGLHEECICLRLWKNVFGEVTSSSESESSVLSAWSSQRRERSSTHYGMYHRCNCVNSSGHGSSAMLGLTFGQLVEFG